MPNIKLNYLYRDASNYKQYGSVVFANTNNIAAKTINNIIKSNLIDGEFFVAEAWEIPVLYFDNIIDADHNWHEFQNIEVTAEMPYSNLEIENLLNKILVVE
ncbi:hypothetical protein [Flavobacterium rhizosphaerae]|uniref:Uncharacterized protein n=1 Tax=Flavobacterium rhizosphaerae TaxID=3163298 RepID=A0ABW8YXU0_9FLAO